MDLMIPRINFYSDLNNHTYYFEDPDFTTEIAKKFENKVMKNKQQALDVLTHLHSEFEKLGEEFKRDDIHKV